MAEPIPATAVESILDAQWNAGIVTKPSLIDINNTVDAPRINLHLGDYVIIVADMPTMREEPIGNWLYAHQTYQVTLELYTKTSRQRLYNLMREIRRVIHAKTHDLTGFMRAKFVDFVEDADAQQNIWIGRITVELTNNANLMNKTS